MDLIYSRANDLTPKLSRILLTCLFLTLLILSATAQVPNDKGAIKGKIITSDSLDAGLVVVGLKGTNKGTTTNANGEFTLEKIPAGSYTLVAQIVGYESIETSVEVIGGQMVTLDNIRLKEDSKTLHEVVVQGNRNKFAQRESEMVARLPLKNLENPQVYNTVSKELMQEQVVTNFDDALKNAPGVNRLWASTGRGGDGAGFFSMRGFSVQPTMVNGVAGQTNGGIDPANIERIETIKGPSGTLFGSSLVSFGGLINIVTKKPYETFGGQIDYTAGSYDLNRITLDINSPVNKEKTLLVRLNSAYHYEGSFQDAGFQKKLFIAPSITYKVNNRLTFHVTTEIMNAEGTNPFMLFLNRSRTLIRRNMDELNVNFKRSFTSNDITMKNQTTNIFGQINYKLSDQWTAQTNISRSIRTSDGYYSYAMFLDAGNDDTLHRYIQDQTIVGKTTQIQQNLIGDTKILGLRNRIVIGVDYFSTVTQNNSTPYILFDRVSAQNAADPQYNRLNQNALSARFGASGAANIKSGSDARTYGAYVSNVLNITTKLSAMASIRFDHFVNMGSYNYANHTIAPNSEYSQNAWSPKFGLVYQIVQDKISVFSNYMNGFRNVAPVTQPLADISGTFKPQQVNQLEVGFKVEAIKNRVSLTASYYDLIVTNMTRAESIVRGGTTYNITVQNGSQKSQGVEIDLIANPIDGLNLVMGYSFNNSKDLLTSAATEGRRPVSAGPENLINAWISYTIPRGTLKGIGAGIGGNHASENIITNNANTGQFILPAYTVYNASLFYNTNKYRISLKVDNLTDEAYYTGWTTIERQMARRFLASFTFKF